MTAATDSFAGQVVAWQATHGRSGLPWQGTRDPYRVWLSEIMLQQTQVSTVLAYFPRFLERFPDVASLAAAPQDDVLALWSGLGYYSRARNLHRCAQEVMQAHAAAFPRDAQTLQTLPGIGRSTAAAIASFCFGERAAILDGNVKRVLTRVLGFADDLSVAANEKRLWALAEGMLPQASADMPRYTQGLMDLGATVCLARRPSCLVCPVREGCVAQAQGQPERFPVKTRKLKRTAQSLWLLQASQPDGAVWLEKRPDSGVWAGLYCLPVFDSFDALREVASPGLTLEEREPFTHVLTHKDLHLHPVAVTAQLTAPLLAAARDGSDMGVAEPAPAGWFTADSWPKLGLPAPIRKLLEIG
ncbi:MAG TPA: A/G-specific adenine glycosylase [Ramlibacter sp.]|nr:A/G-specific adenine glycosylase [Ramlibacter sp.]